MDIQNVNSTKQPLTVDEYISSVKLETLTKEDVLRYIEIVNAKIRLAELEKTTGDVEKLQMFTKQLSERLAIAQVKAVDEQVENVQQIVDIKDAKLAVREVVEEMLHDTAKSSSSQLIIKLPLGCTSSTLLTCITIIETIVIALLLSNKKYSHTAPENIIIATVTGLYTFIALILTEAFIAGRPLKCKESAKTTTGLSESTIRSIDPNNSLSKFTVIKDTQVGGRARSYADTFADGDINSIQLITKIEAQSLISCKAQRDIQIQAIKTKYLQEIETLQQTNTKQTKQIEELNSQIIELKKTDEK